MIAFMAHQVPGQKLKCKPYILQIKTYYLSAKHHFFNYSTLVIEE